jgi:hypothetical protein
MIATMSLIVMVSGAARGATDELPLKTGFFARIENGCDPQGSYPAYDSMLTYRPGELNNSSMARTILDVRRGPLKILHVLLDVTGGPGASADELGRKTWAMKVEDPENFTLLADPADESWSGRYRYCFENLPSK